MGDSFQGEGRAGPGALGDRERAAVVISRAFVKKTEKTPTDEIDTALERAKELKP